MRDQLQSFVQGAVMFDVHSLVFGIGNAKQGFCVLIVFSRIIDLSSIPSNVGNRMSFESNNLYKILP